MTASILGLQATEIDSELSREITDLAEYQVHTKSMRRLGACPLQNTGTSEMLQGFHWQEWIESP